MEWKLVCLFSQTNNHPDDINPIDVNLPWWKFAYQLGFVFVFFTLEVTGFEYS